jgi:hypothetical protein
MPGLFAAVGAALDEALASAAAEATAAQSPPPSRRVPTPLFRDLAR